VIGTVSENRIAVGLTGVGSYVPERVLTNADLEAMVETSDEWIVTRTGISERHIAAPEQAASDLALPAAREALEQAGVEPEELDLVIVATATPDMLFPATAAIVADTLGAKTAAAYDLLAGCTGFVYALSQAYGQVATGLSKRALVVRTARPASSSATAPGRRSSSRSRRAASPGSSWARTARAGPTCACRRAAPAGRSLRTRSRRRRSSSR
jgi:3-oxoacyl-(acyl-carrier-protein) synthase III